MLILPFKVVHDHVLPVTGVEEAFCLGGSASQPVSSHTVSHCAMLCWLSRDMIYFSVLVQDCSGEDYHWVDLIYSFDIFCVECYRPISCLSLLFGCSFSSFISAAETNAGFV